MARVYILYDGRAIGGDTDDAMPLEVCRNNKEAREARGDHGAMACYSYAEKGADLVDERFEWAFDETSPEWPDG